MTYLLIALAVVAAAALAWWLTRARPKPEVEEHLSLEDLEALDPGPPDDLFPKPFTGNVRYEAHALLRRRQRSISDANVREALGDPISVKPTRRKGKCRMEVRGRTDVRTLRLIVDKWPAERPRVITVVWVDKEIIEVPTKRLGALIGKGGRTIKRIQSESGANVVVHKDQSGDRTNVTIQSMFEWDREAARAAIEEVVG